MTIDFNDILSMAHLKRLYRAWKLGQLLGKSLTMNDIEKTKHFEYLAEYLAPTVSPVAYGCPPIKEEKGNNPMRYDHSLGAYIKEVPTVAATAITVQAASAPSDEMTQRDFLLKELSSIVSKGRMDWSGDSWSYKLRKMFHIDAPKIPQTSQELIDAFAKGKIKIDQKKVDANAKFQADGDEYDGRYDDEDDYIGRQFYGITFTDIPVADCDGYQAALKELADLETDTKRTIMIGTPAEGLTALKKLESWEPSNKPKTKH